MATQKFKAALTNSKFPFLYAHAPRAVLQQGLDPTARLPFSYMGNPASADYNSIEMLYCENAVPTANGYASVRFDDAIAALGGSSFERFSVVRRSDETSYLIAIYVSGVFGSAYLYDPATDEWVNNFFYYSPSAYDLHSIIYVGGKTYYFVQQGVLLELSGTSLSFKYADLRLPENYSSSDIMCGCGASNYMILATESEILWSAPTDSLEFADTLLGAGRQIPIDLKGKIRATVPISGGFIIYTTKNAVAAFFTNRADTPFLFKEILGSAGILSSEQVTGDANGSEHYVYGHAGIQRVSLQRADTILPDCADFLSGDAYNQWNSTTHTVDQINSAQSKIKINLILNRYLVISYAFASSQFQQALIYDLSLERWGKVKTPHVDVGLLPWAINSAAGSRPATIEELTDPIEDYVVPIGNFNVLTGEDTVELELLHWRDNIGFMSYDAAIKAMKVENSLQSVESGSGVLVFGHVQVTRGRKVTLQAIELDGLVDGNVYVLPSLSGYDRDTSQATTLTDSDGNYKQYRKRVTAENFDVAIEAGSFSLSSVVIETTIHGSR